MCGIAGLVGRDDRVVQRMLDRLGHRGPDGEGLWSDAQVTLGHRRLAILDVEHGQQPMTSANGRYVLVYNGECYNHEALRAALAAEGVRFATRTDSETVLEGYARWGPAVLQRMEGMFAFAIWDTQARELFVARDPFGIKPFFWALAGGDFVFASEQKALFAHPELRAEPDVDRLKERAALEFLTGQATLFRGVHQLPPGTWARIQPGTRRVDWHLYHQVPFEHFGSIEEAARVIQKRFVASVQEQLLSDVPLGTVLSGGLDSAAVAVVHAKLAEGHPIHTFTVAEDESVADFQAARGLAEQLGSDHHEAFFDLEGMVRDLPNYVWHNENINYTEYFFHPLFRMMRQSVTVGLCGQGADELWGGYERYKAPAALAEERLQRLRAARPAHQEVLEGQVALTHMTGSALAEWDQQGQLSNFQLRLVDRNSMAHGLEVRVPFLSRPLQAASRAVPWGWKMHPNGALIEKWILRKSFAQLGLPESLLWRTKVPAGRATGPRVMQQFEALAARLVPKRSDGLSGAFRLPAERLLADLWTEVFVHRDGQIKGLRVEDLYA
jgi:asparagine synthase (glutamine-hydrolysing)